MKHLYPRDVENLKEKLLKTEKELAQQTHELEQPPDAGSDVDSFEEEGQEAEAFGLNLGIDDLVKRRLDAVREALGKIEKGVYGICEKCRQPISVELLSADPESELCTACKTAGKHGRSR